MHNFAHQGGSEEWFVLGEESIENVGTDLPLEDEELTKPGIPDSEMKEKGENITQVDKHCILMTDPN